MQGVKPKVTPPHPGPVLARRRPCRSQCEGRRNSRVLPTLSPTVTRTRGNEIDKDRIEGSAQQAKGKVKEVAGKVLGDSKLEAEGKADKAAGKIQNAVGGLKDAIRGK